MTNQDKLETIYDEVRKFCEEVLWDKSYHPKKQELAGQILHIYFRVEKNV